MPPVSVRRRSMPVESIRRQPDPERHCGFYALQNLYVWCGLEPPEFAHMLALACEGYTNAPEHLGLRTVDQFGLLGALQFPRLAAYAMMPRAASARTVLPPLVAQGAGLLINYNYKWNGKVYGHAAVVESCADEGLTVLCSGPATGHGATVRWEDDGPDEADTDARPHGCKMIVPWRTQGYTLWVLGALEQLGIAREFIIVWPAEVGAG